MKAILLVCVWGGGGVFLAWLGNQPTERHNIQDYLVKKKSQIFSVVSSFYQNTYLSNSVYFSPSSYISSSLLYGILFTLLPSFPKQIQVASSTCPHFQAQVLGIMPFLQLVSIMIRSQFAQDKGMREQYITKKRQFLSILFSCFSINQE